MNTAPVPIWMTLKSSTLASNRSTAPPRAPRTATEASRSLKIGDEAGLSRFLCLGPHPQIFGLPFLDPFFPHGRTFQLPDDDGGFHVGDGPLVQAAALGSKGIAGCHRG